MEIVGEEIEEVVVEKMMEIEKVKLKKIYL